MGGAVRDRPGLRAIEARAKPVLGGGNLPAELTSFVGRTVELTALAGRLDDSRLVTVTGPPGAGKSRLALHLAHRLAAHHLEGGWLVELASLADPDRVTEFAARTLGLRAERGRTWTHILVDRLAVWDALIVVDNCEHLLLAVGKLVHLLLTRCPNVRVLATSRERLHVGGETVWPLEPLPNADAVTLFIDRARAVAPGLDAGAEQIPVICRRLDGIPLGIELAAARAGAMSLEAIAQRLTDRFRLLTTGDPTAPARQQTLRAAVEWSHALLDEPQRHVFRRTAVFVEGFDLEAAEAVCSGDQAGATDVAERLVALVEKSLVRSEGGRYRLLETMREFATERLAEADETGGTRAAHARHFADLADRAAQARASPAETRWLDRLWAERGNLRAALDWACRNDGEAAASLALAMSLMWWVRGDLGEALVCLERAMATPAADPVRRTMVVVEAASFAETRGDLALAHRLHDLALADARRLDDKVLLARCLDFSGWCLCREGHIADGLERLYEGLRLYEELGQPALMASVLIHLAGAVGWAGDLATAHRLSARAVENSRRHGEERLMAMALVFSATAGYLQADEKLASEALQESIRLCQRLADHLAGCYALGLAAALAAKRSAFARALALESAAATLENRIGIERDEGWARLVAGAIQPALSSLTPAAVESAVATGRVLDFEQALVYASGAVLARAATPLTRREIEVASFVAGGMTAKEIASRLHLSVRTVESHLERIRDKLDVHSRSQIAAWVVQQRWLSN